MNLRPTDYEFDPALCPTREIEPRESLTSGFSPQGRPTMRNLSQSVAGPMRDTSRAGLAERRESALLCIRTSERVKPNRGLPTGTTAGSVSWGRRTEPRVSTGHRRTDRSRTTRRQHRARISSRSCAATPGRVRPSPQVLVSRLTISSWVQGSAPHSVCCWCSARVLPIRPRPDLPLRSDCERIPITTQQDGVLTCRTAGPSFPSSRRRDEATSEGVQLSNAPLPLRRFTLDFTFRRAGSTCRLKGLGGHRDR